MAGDPFNLERFLEAQGGGVYEQALSELKAGQKRSHWMWFIFPQHADLGRSPTAKYYGLSGVGEARAYLSHTLLGQRLHECCAAILPHLHDRPAAEILGDIDALKLRSAMQLFREAAPEDPIFAEVLAADAQSVPRTDLRLS